MLPTFEVGAVPNSACSLFDTAVLMYSTGRDQEDNGLKPAWANSSRRPHLGKTLHPKEPVQDVSPEFKPQYHKKINPNALASQGKRTRSFWGIPFLHHLFLCFEIPVLLQSRFLSLGITSVLT
jgi:hypothetical protein